MHLNICKVCREAYHFEHAVRVFLRKDAKGLSCQLRTVDAVKASTTDVTSGGSLGFLELQSRACVAVNAGRIKLCLMEWSRKPIELNGLDLICLQENFQIG